MIRSLIWKECREQWPRAALAAGVLVGLVLLGAAWGPDGITYAMIPAHVLGAVLFPLVIAAGAIAGDRARGTLELLTTLPVRPWKVLAVKTVVGLLACEVPLMALFAAAVLFWPPRPLGAADLLQRFAPLGMTFAALQYFWTQFLGARRPSETGAAMCGALGTALAIASAVLLALLAQDKKIPGWFVTCHPLALLGLIGAEARAEARFWLIQGIAQTLTLAAGWAWMVHVWPRPLVQPESRRALSAPPNRHLLPKPPLGRWASLLWKEWREVRAAIPAAAAVVIAPMVLIAGGMLLHSATLSMQLLGALTQVALYMSYVLAIAMPVLIATGSVSADLNPRVQEFWSSRPIDAGRSFLAKYVTGLAVVLVAVAVPLLLVALMAPWADADPEMLSLLPWTPLAATAELLIAYGLAILVASVIPRPVTAAVLTWSLLALAHLAGAALLRRTWPQPFPWHVEIALLATAALALAVLPPLFAWRLWARRGTVACA